MIDIHFVNRWNFSLLNGLQIEQVGSDVKTGSQSIPERFSLSQNYPNPFNSATIIKYAVPKPCKIQIILYNLLGQQIKRLVDEPKATGIHSVQVQSVDLTSGIYFYQLLAGEFFQTKKLIVMR